MTEILEFPFNSGAYDGQDRKWLPNGALKTAENVRLTRDGRLEVRPAYTAVSMAAYNGNTLAAYDLANYRGRLVALGNAESTHRGIIGIFEYLPGQTKLWSGFDNTVSPVTHVREIGQPPYQVARVTSAMAVAYNSRLVQVYLTTQAAYVSVFTAANQALFFGTLAAFPKVPQVAITQAGVALIVGKSSGNALGGVLVNPATATSYSESGAVTIASATVSDIYRVVGCTGTGAAGYAVVYAKTGSLIVDVLNAAGVSVGGAYPVTLGSLSGSLSAVDIVADATADRLSVALVDSGVSSVQVYTITLSTGGSSVGPSTVITSASGSVAIIRKDASRLWVAGETNATSPVATAVVDPTRAAHSVSTTYTYQSGLLRTNLVSAFTAAIATPMFGYYPGFSDASVEDVNKAALIAAPEFGVPWLAANQLRGVDALGWIAVDIITGKYYWTTLWAIQSNADIPFTTTSVLEFDVGSQERRSMVESGGLLVIAGGMPAVYDGRIAVESGFAEAPRVGLATGSNGAGGLSLGRYSIQVVCEWIDSQGNLHLSPASNVRDVTLAGSDDTITVAVLVPHTWRRLASLGSQISVVVYRTVADGEVFHRDSRSALSFTDGNTDDISFTLLRSDTDIGDEAVIYTQVQTPLPHFAAPSAEYLAAGRQRVIAGGLPRRERVTQSKVLFPSEALEWPSAGRLGFVADVGRDITAVAALDNTAVLWTADAPYIITGAGPDSSGLGDFDAPQRVPSVGGCADWRSVVETPDGLFFQVQDELLYMLPRGGGAPTFVGEAVRDVLKSYPVIVASAFIRGQLSVAFACTNTAGSLGKLLIYDMRRQQWFTDDVLASAVAEYDGKLALIRAGNIVYVQDAAPGTGTFITQTVETGSLRIGAALGWGRIFQVGLLAEVVGACTVTTSVTYDDGSNYTSLGAVTFVGNEGHVQKLWSLSIQKTARLGLKFVVTGTTDSVGVRMNGFAIEVEGSSKMVRLGASGQVS